MLQKLPKVVLPKDEEATTLTLVEREVLRAVYDCFDGSVSQVLAEVERRFGPFSFAGPLAFEFASAILSLREKGLVVAWGHGLGVTPKGRSVRDGF